MVSAHHGEGDVWVVDNHLEGNFAGGHVDLRYKLVLQHDKIVRLVTVGKGNRSTSGESQA